MQGCMGACSRVPATPSTPLQVVQQMVTRAGLRPDRLLLVGGFGSSAYLQLKLENRFGGRRCLLCGAAPCPLATLVRCAATVLLCHPQRLLQLMLARPSLPPRQATPWATCSTRPTATPPWWRALCATCRSRPPSSSASPPSPTACACSSTGAARCPRATSSGTPTTRRTSRTRPSWWRCARARRSR